MSTSIISGTRSATPAPLPDFRTLRPASRGERAKSVTKQIANPLVKPIVDGFKRDWPDVKKQGIAFKNTMQETAQSTWKDGIVPGLEGLGSGAAGLAVGGTSLVGGVAGAAGGTI